MIARSSPFFTMRYFFKLKEDGKGFHHISTDGLAVIDFYIGEFLAHCFCDDLDNDLDLVRFWRRGLGEHIVVQRRLNDISLWICTQENPREYAKCLKTQGMQSFTTERR